jgi:hypothetical protein
MHVYEGKGSLEGERREGDVELPHRELREHERRSVHCRRIVLHPITCVCVCVCVCVRKCVCVQVCVCTRACGGYSINTYTYTHTHTRTHTHKHTQTHRDIAAGWESEAVGETWCWHLWRTTGTQSVLKGTSGCNSRRTAKKKNLKPVMKQ